MFEYRLFYLDRNSHAIGREEFVAEDDNAASMIAVLLCEKSDRPHFGLMLLQRARQVFATYEVTGPLVVFASAIGNHACRLNSRAGSAT